jgi:hypothetical protein
MLISKDNMVVEMGTKTDTTLRLTILPSLTLTDIDTDTDTEIDIDTDTDTDMDTFNRKLTKNKNVESVEFLKFYQIE